MAFLGQTFLPLCKTKLSAGLIDMRLTTPKKKYHSPFNGEVWIFTLDNSDVVCLIKKHICDHELRQKPLLVPTSRQAEGIPDLPAGKHPLRTMSSQVKENWLKLASQVEFFYGPSHAPAAEYLRKMERNFFYAESEPESYPWLGIQDHRLPPEEIFDLHRCVLDAISPSQPLRAIWSAG